MVNPRLTETLLKNPRLYCKKLKNPRLKETHKNKTLRLVTNAVLIPANFYVPFATPGMGIFFAHMCVVNLTWPYTNLLDLSF